MGQIGYEIGCNEFVMQEPKIIITQEMLRLISEIDVFRGKWELLRNMSSPERLRSLRKVATIESIGSSTRIEGATLTDTQVESLLSNVTSASFKSRDTQEVAGYAEAIDLVFQAYEDMTLTENHIRQLHQTLLRHSSKDERHRGEYKKISNDIIAFNEQGKEICVVLKTTTPFDTPRAMEDLVQWVNKSIAEKSMHSLLIVAVFIVVFLAIHPFQDGNGRLSRILTTLMLLRMGYTYVSYVSLESIIEKNKDLYYRALRRTQTTLKSDSPDWEPWLGFFLRCLEKQKSKLAAKLEREKAINNADLKKLSVQVLELFREHERLTISEMKKYIGAKKNTLKLRLRELVQDGHIQRHGKARATWYTLKKN